MNVKVRAGKIEAALLIPAYGRSYATADAAKADFLDGKDFMLAGGGPYCSVRDFAPGGEAVLVYGKKRELKTTLTV